MGRQDRKRHPDRQREHREPPDAVRDEGRVG
jgi:hypothetical protein